MPIDRNNAQYITGAIYKPTQTSAPGVWDLDDQANNISKNLWPLPPQAVQRSLRFNSADSAYLNRTPAVAGSRTTWTWSAWVKRAGLYTTNAGPTLFDVGPDNGNFMFIRFNSDTQDVIDFGWTVSGSVVCRIRSTASFRDSSAWYHIVAVLDTTNATSTDRMRLYVNGQRLTSFGVTTYPAQNTATCYVNATNIHYLGRSVEPLYRYMDGYISEVNLIDGQALDATSFGETDQQTGVWIPKRYLGTYGTNGFRLSFANNSSTTALGYDSSGQGNNWTTNNFSITPGVGNDVFVDVPSMYNTDTGLGGEVLGNYCVFSAVASNMSAGSITNGGLEATAMTGEGQKRGSLAVNSGKWYWEVVITAGQADAAVIGVVNSSVSSTASVFSASGIIHYYSYSGNKYVDGTASAYGATYTTNDVIGIALNMDAGTITFYKNNVSQGTISFTSITNAIPMIGSGAGSVTTTYATNFGQRPFVYTAPSGYKALCTTNLPAPAIGQTSSNQADNHFNVVTYTGNGGTQTISTLDFQPDLVWIKNRTGANSHILVDSIRGVGKGISSEAVTGEYNIPTDFQSFNSNGFTVGYGGTNITNASANNYVAWSWRAATTTVVNTTGTITTNVRANQTSRFSIVRYTGNNGSSQTVGHGLNAIPDMIIVKNLDSSNANWLVYHKSLGSSSKLLLLNTTGIVLNIANYWGSNLPTNSVFGVGDGGGWDNNTNTHRHIAYCWAEVPGYSAFGSYTGNGSSDGPFVYTGFKPRWVMVKATSIEGNWIIWDIARNTTNTMAKMLFPDATAAELDNSSYNNDFLSNGFKVRGTGGAFNTNAAPYIYAAFAETPARLSTAR